MKSNHRLDVGLYIYIHRGLRRSEMTMDDRGLHPNVFVFVFNFINVSRWVVAASFMAENPNMGWQSLLQIKHIYVWFRVG